MQSAKAIVLAGIFVLLMGSSSLWAPPQDSDGEWPMFGGDLSNSHFSRLTEINKNNVGQIQIAWEWRPNEKPIPQYGAKPSRFAATPIMIDGVLYVSTSYHRVVALDATTGKELWSYDPHASPHSVREYESKGGDHELQGRG